jgi:uncharacterized protein (TIGR00725 family)
MLRIVVGVMGASDTATALDLEYAFELGGKIAEQGWALVTGGMKCGVMDAASRGAQSRGGLVIGIIPQIDSEISEAVEIAIRTNIGNARNQINALTSDIMIVCGTISPGTLSEIAFALAVERPIVLLSPEPTARQFIKGMGGDTVTLVESPADAIVATAAILRQALR